MTTFDTLSWMPRRKLPTEEKRRGISARILPSLIDRLEQIADEHEWSLSFMIEKAIKAYVDQHAASKEPPAKSRPRHK
jgi:hypothetical protein